MSDRRLDSVVQTLDYEGDAEGLHVLIVGAGMWNLNNIEASLALSWMFKKEIKVSDLSVVDLS